MAFTTWRQPLRYLALVGLILAVALPAQCGNSWEQAESRFAEMDGHQIHYKVLGPADAPAVVLIHGWACNLDLWRDTAPDMAKTMRVVALDLPGHGQSKPPADLISYTQELLARGVATVIAAAGVKKPILAGHSMGLSVARKLCLDQPALARGVFSVDGALLPLAPPPPTLSQWLQAHQTFVQNFRGDRYQPFIKEWVPTMFGPNLPKDRGEWVLEQMLATPKAVGLSAMQNFIDPTLWKASPKVDLPARGIYAKTKDLPPDLESLLRVYFPRMKITLWEGVGHFYMLERPAELAQAVAEFSAGIEP